jgi:hypothetical protein
MFGADLRRSSARLFYDGFDKVPPAWLLPANWLAVLPAEAT